MSPEARAFIELLAREIGDELVRDSENAGVQTTPQPGCALKNLEKETPMTTSARVSHRRLVHQSERTTNNDESYSCCITQASS